jgi:hypothetical protein
MKRSGGVTAAVIVLFFGSGVFVLLAAGMFLSSFLMQATKEPSPLGPAFFYVEAGIMLGLAGWGVSTGVGILRLRSWARISILVMSGLAVVMSFFTMLMTFMLVPMISENEKMPPGAIIFVEIFEVIIFGIPLAVAVWWLILFMRKGTRAQFEAASRTTMAHRLVAGGATVVEAAAATASPVSKIPVSILVIAVYFLATAPGQLFTFAMPFMRHMPMMIFGKIMQPGSMWAYMLTVAVLHLALGIGLLCRKWWAYFGTCGYCVFLFANAAATLLRRFPMDRFLVMMQQADPALARMNVTLPPAFMHYGMFVASLFGMALPIAALYFLWTRRGAYRAACAAR